MEVINSEVSEGDQPIVKSRYSIIIATAKRARQIIGGEEPLINGKDRKPLSVAIDEIYTGEVKIIGVGDASADDDKFIDLADEVLDVALEDDEEMLFEDHKDEPISVSEEIEIEE